VIPTRAYHHLPLCPACMVGIAWASLGAVAAVGRVSVWLFGAPL
jgi:hypothetical protein